MGARAALRGKNWAAHAALALCALNAADAVLTHRFLTQGLATEANPLMRLAWDLSPLAFWSLKLTLVGVAALFLVSQRRRLGAPLALLVGVAAYAAVLAYHLVLVGNGLLARAVAVP